MPSRSVIAIRDVAFSYDSSAEPLFTGLSAHFPAGFTGIIGANGAGKSTLLRIMTGELSPGSGSVERPVDTAYCAQPTDHPPPTLRDFLDDWSGEACELRGRFDIGSDAWGRWRSLSHGERKRAQIAAALFQSTSLLALDEPTNHIDAYTRELLISSLRQYRGVGLIVSHDREFLDKLCNQCLWLDPPHGQVFTGGFTQAREQKKAAHATAVRTRKKLVDENKRLEREVRNRREKTAKEHSQRSKRGLSRHDSDARDRIDRARVSDGGAGGQLRQLDGRLLRAQAQLEDSSVKKTYDASIWLEGSRSQRDSLLTLQAGEKALGDNRLLKWPALTIKPDDRIALTGANGVGKSTWIEHILPLLNVPKEQTIIVKQELPSAIARELLDTVRSYPKEQLGHIMSVVSRLNSRPERLLQSPEPSPGELRKLLLAMGLAKRPHIIVMDEPTNHLDLPSIEALEDALADCPCALVLVSHDHRFIKNVGARDWRIEIDDDGDSVLLPP